MLKAILSSWCSGMIACLVVHWSWVRSLLRSSILVKYVIFIIFDWLKLLHKWNTSSQQGPRFAAFFKNFGIQLLYVWCLSFCGQIFLKASNLGAYCHRIHSQKTFLWQFRDMAMKRKFGDFFFFFILLLENIYFDTHDADSPDFFKNVSTFNSDLLWTW